MSAPTLAMRAAVAAEQVRAEARDVDPVRVLLTVLAVVPFVLGWVAGALVRVVWALLAWSWAAAVVGWRMARGVDGGGG
jgi:hypothetical protein